MQLAVNYLSWRPVHLSDGMRGWVTCECVTWSDGWWFVIRAGCPHLRGRGVMSPLRGGSQTGYHGAGDKGGEASTNIMSALRCNKTLYSNNNTYQYFQRDMYNILQARLVNSHRDLRQSVESPLGHQVIIVILIGLHGVPITSSQHSFNSSHPFPGFDWE